MEVSASANKRLDLYRTCPEDGSDLGVSRRNGISNSLSLSLSLSVLIIFPAFHPDAETEDCSVR